MQQQAFDAVCNGDTPPAPGGTTDQDCADAQGRLTSNILSCTPTADNPTIICSGDCRGYYDAIFDSCAADVSLDIV